PTRRLFRSLKWSGCYFRSFLGAGVISSQICIFDSFLKGRSKPGYGFSIVFGTSEALASAWGKRDTVFRSIWHERDARASVGIANKCGFKQIIEIIDGNLELVKKKGS
ncbi:MAG TPA: hypothetical protein VK183_10010, partial [Flavobacterium sp.]|nr:hypothetical protein [Flavobacterium sp.]